MGIWERGAGRLIAGTARHVWVLRLLASGIDDKPWTDDILKPGTGIEGKAIALEREILEIVNGKR
jgi:hypothetical protein